MTDWDKYYLSTPKYTSVTRAISARKIVNLIRGIATEAPLRICELGGANSSFIEAICRDVRVSHYHVADLNDHGLRLLMQKSVPTVLTCERAEVLDPYQRDEKFDLVFSVGLVEHFDTKGTKKAIEAHFQRCMPGGHVLITFPTPTLPYRFIRGVAEWSGRWAFPDERPLSFEEVETTCAPHGTIEHRSINWLIGLTQGYVVTEMKA